MKIVSEDKVVENRTGELLSEWEKEKPVEVNITARNRYYCFLTMFYIFVITCLKQYFNIATDHEKCF